MFGIQSYARSCAKGILTDRYLMFSILLERHDATEYSTCYAIIHFSSRAHAKLQMI